MKTFQYDIGEQPILNILYLKKDDITNRLIILEDKVLLTFDMRNMDILWSKYHGSPTWSVDEIALYNSQVELKQILAEALL